VVIEAREFVSAARKRGIEWYTGVPCSFLTPFINHVIAEPDLRYLSSANEGDALATAAGMAIGGRGAAVMMQNSGLGNAVSPLTSLAHVFRIPLLLICTHRGAPDLHDEPQHELMGAITESLFDLMQVPWEPFPREASHVEAALDRARKHFASQSRPYGLLMSKGAIAGDESAGAQSGRPVSRDSVEQVRRSEVGAAASRSEVLRRILAATPTDGTVVIATTGYTGRELYEIADRANHLYMVGSMGCASSLGLGIALARPDLSIVVIDGDGAALMRMGNLATIGAYAGGNFVHLLLDNESHESTGAQATVSASVDFAMIAVACGYAPVLAGRDLDLIDELFAAPSSDRPRLLHLKIRTGTPTRLPRPAIGPEAVVRRLMHHIGSHFHA
jgi:phosphonopyruvate decarboxylase